MVNPYSYVGIKDFHPPINKLLPEKQDELAHHIIEVVCGFYQVKQEKIMTRWRARPYVEIRQMCMFLIKEKTGMSLKRIGELFNRDHTTAIHSIKTISDLYITDEYVGKCLNTLRMRL